jgi:hypothetical protein
VGFACVAGSRQLIDRVGAAPAAFRILIKRKSGRAPSDNTLLANNGVAGYHGGAVLF